MSVVVAQSPSSVLDWTFNWNDGWLESDETISTSVMTIIPAGVGLVVDSSSIVPGDKTTNVFLSGAKHGVEYIVSNKITTNKSRTDVRSFLVRGYFNP